LAHPQGGKLLDILGKVRIENIDKNVISSSKFGMSGFYLNRLLKLQKSGGKIGLVGLGLENLQFLDWLVFEISFPVSQIYLADKIDKKELLEKYQIPSENLFFNSEYLQILDSVDWVFKSPGIWSLLPEFENFRNKKGEDFVSSSLVFFLEKFRDEIVAVTGTKGKSTTSNLIFHTLQTFGYQVFYAGNTTNISPYKFWNQENSYFVLELSSFQLQDLGNSNLSSKYAIITNLYIDHQDQHGSVSEYWLSKMEIFRSQKDGDFFVTTKDVFEKIDKSKKSKIENLAKNVIINKKDEQKISEKYPSSLLGEHNLENMTLAFRICEAIYLENLPKLLQKSSSSYQNLAHRLEFVTKKKYAEKEVFFYDDGAATEGQAVMAAIETLTQNADLWLFITGVDKGSEIPKLANLIEKKVFKASLCGEIGLKIYNFLVSDFEDKNPNSKVSFREKYPNIIYHKSFKLALISEFENFEKVLEISQKNRLNVVLSPSGSSFDEFKNYLERCDFYLTNIKNLTEN
jgi:UDP-N-acetylmuramoylalanine--D-glutamate ligase